MRFQLIAALALAVLAGWVSNPARSAQLAAVQPVLACEGLTKADIDAAVGAKTHIESATTVAGTGGGSYCRVLGVIAPAIRFEVQLPVAHWTQRFVQTGCGGLCGMLHIDLDKDDSCKPAQNGELVLASTDMGHEGNMDGHGVTMTTRRASTSLIAVCTSRPWRLKPSSNTTTAGTPATRTSSAAPMVAARL